MIIVHGTIPLREDRRDRALELARVMADATQAEPGCVSYDFYIGLRDPNTLMVFQEWEDMDALMAHFQTAHMESFLRELPELTSGDITTRRYAVQSVDGQEAKESRGPRVVH
ncbi:MAG: antibiotic biosynthesis monooxygenase [Gammaproteobacteria bacterium]|nr:MAG: antibiotic biosynthesis monooxygenase [Gammaproteobacteria bacterium]